MTTVIQRLAIAIALWLYAAPIGAQPDLHLARIDTAAASLPPLPVYARLQDAAGQPYLLVKASSADLTASGCTYQLLDDNAASTAYLLAFEFRPGARAAARAAFPVLHDDGRRLILRVSSGTEAEQLSSLGFQCRPLPETPLPILESLAKSLPDVAKVAITRDPAIAALLASVTPTNLYRQLAELTGVRSVTADGIAGILRTRHTDSGTPIRRATALAYERFTALGLHPRYQSWSAGGYAGRNVIATWPGTSRASEIVLVGAHIDDMPAGGNAPGADDNASGSLAVLTAAELLRTRSFERTLRFVIFTGEEQGLYGSDAYARAAQAAGDRIVAVLNFDMIAWDGDGDGRLHLYVRPARDSGHAADLALAAAFTNVVRTYGLAGLAPRILAEVSDWSDHYSFTLQGFPAICGIEDDVSDFHPYYHTAQDTLDRLNIPYYTRYVQAIVGTAAHLALPVVGNPQLALSPTTRTHSPRAVSGQTFAVRANVDWTATANRSWITITSGRSDSNNGTVTYRLAAHTGSALRSGAITVSGGGLRRTFTLRQAAGDAYEPDNLRSDAKPLANGQPQRRSIHRPGNVDWARFTIPAAGARDVRLETSGIRGDTQLWLTRASGALLAYDNDSGPGLFSRISRPSLPPGTYFLKIQENANNGIIPSYTLRATWSLPPP